MARLRAAGCVFAEEEAALLVAAAATPAELERLVGARVAGTPLELLLGYAEFCGLRVAVAPGVFVPRRRTALLVERAAALLRPGAVVVDLCCGTGAIGAALAARVAGLEVWAADVDPDAVACARGNLPPERVLEGDLYDALPDRLRGRVDVLVANAPYVPSGAIGLMPPEARDHEHRTALDGGDRRARAAGPGRGGRPRLAGSRRRAAGRDQRPPGGRHPRPAASGPGWRWSSPRTRRSAARWPSAASRPAARRPGS